MQEQREVKNIHFQMNKYARILFAYKILTEYKKKVT